jgi:uncharacterized delta-60 repeat protein
VDTPGAPDPDFGNNGTVRTDFGLDGWAQPTDLALQSDGKLVLVGQVQGTIALERFEATGAPDISFGTAGLATLPFSAVALAIQPDNKIVVAGHEYTDTQANFAVARYRLLPHNRTSGCVGPRRAHHVGDQPVESPG